MLAANQILQGRYRIVRQLGHGGMGAVYEAIDERFGEPIALKEILLDLTNPDNEIQKIAVLKAFEREAKSLAKARHRAIPFVRDYFSEIGRQFLVMELVEGDDLEKLLQKRGSPFPLEDVLKWTDQLLDALDYLHSLNPPIIHRDIKPQNLKLNERQRIKLLDFGIAKSDNQTSTITNQTFVGATLNYSPIEQILRVIDPMFREYVLLKHKAEAEKVLNQTTDARCDLYALGATFYHLLTNHFPIGSAKRGLEIWEGKRDPLPNPSELNPEIPLQLSAWLLKAMEIERDNRFSSATEMRKALSAAAGGEKESKEFTTEERWRLMEEERKSQERFLMQAKTERFITGGEIKVDTASKFHTDTQPSFSQPFTQSSASEPVLTDFPLAEAAVTVSSGNIPNPELTATSYLKGILPEKADTLPPEPLSNEEKATTATSNFKVKHLWILPLVFLALLVFGGGIFVAMWWILNQPPAPNSNKLSSGFTTPTPTPTPTPIPTLTPTPTVETPTPTTVETPPETTVPTPTLKPVSSPTPTKVTNTPSRTPVVPNTPRSTPSPKKTNRPCTYEEIIQAGEKKLKCN